jgi:hypothetical protein
LERVEPALAGEIDSVRSTLRQLRNNLYSAMAELVTGSDEYQQLLQAHTAAWMRLRTIKTALRTVTAAMHGQLPQRLMDEAQRSEPLDVRVGYPIDDVLVGAWADAWPHSSKTPMPSCPKFENSQEVWELSARPRGR